MKRFALQFTLVFTGAALLPQLALPQESVTGADCHPESVVLTHCDVTPQSAGGMESTAAKAAREDARKKAELAAALERQRQRNAAVANGDDSQDLDRAQVTGQRLHQKSPGEVFDSYFGSPTILAPDTTQHVDQMGNRTECITHCVGPFCCVTVNANPASPGL